MVEKYTIFIFAAELEVVVVMAAPTIKPKDLVPTNLSYNLAI
jgi:hypothetical protein